MNPLSFFRSLQRPARAMLAFGAVAILLLASLSLWWSLKPRQELLFGGLKQADAAEVVAALEEWKIPHEIVDGGAGISVPKDMVYALRMRLVSSGVPKGGHVGFELFDDSDFGVTEFAQRVNYQRALQGEIERTISALPEIEAVRVHLSIRRNGLFVSDKEASKASVAVSMTSGQTLSRQQIRGIRSLVAAAVEGLSVEQVTVVDSNGNLVAGQGASGLRGVSEQGGEEAEVEERIRQRISALVAHAIESDDFNVSVDVSLNFDTLRQVKDSPVVSGSESGPMVSRKRVNTPTPGTDSDAAESRSEDVEYAHGTIHEEVIRAPGTIQRLSVAVVLPSSIGEQDLEQIRALIATAAGAEELRGDRVEVSRFGRTDTAASATGAGSADGVKAHEVRESSGSMRGRINWDAAAVFLVVGLFVGGLFALTFSGKPARLTARERDIAIERMRAWLRTGSMPS